MELPLIRVFSHVRSGTFWMMDCLHENFYKGRRDVSADQLDPNEKGIYYKYRHPSYALFGGHPFDYAACPPSIYMIRDGRDVCLSMYHSPMFHLAKPPERREGEELSEQILPPPLSEWLIQPMKWKAAPRAILQPGEEALTPIEHWYTSTKNWLRQSDHQFIVRYEDLYYRFEDTMQRIARHFKMDPIRSTWKRPKQSGRWHHKGKPGMWIEEFKGVDLKRWYDIVPYEYQGMYNESHHSTIDNL